MSGLWIALGFLSRVPAPNADFTLQGLAKSLFWFPGVGALLGLLWWGLIAGLSRWLDPTLLAFVLVLAGVLFTGALHLDGVADTFDGFSASGAGKERALAAMKDSRIGAHGAVALMLTLLGKFVAFQNLRLEFASVVCLGAAVVARFGCALVVALVKPARSSGLGATFAGADGTAPPTVARPGVKSAWCGAGWLAVPAFVASASVDRWVVLAIGVGLAALCGFLLVRRCCSGFGGVTGDTHGALIEVTETVLLLVGAACSARFA
jgi:adenosylcobinamide-GDP ribazoletransferase